MSSTTTAQLSSTDVPLLIVRSGVESPADWIVVTAQQVMSAYLDIRSHHRDVLRCQTRLLHADQVIMKDFEEFADALSALVAECQKVLTWGAEPLRHFNLASSESARAATDHAQEMVDRFGPLRSVVEEMHQEDVEDRFTTEPLEGSQVEALREALAEF